MQFWGQKIVMRGTSFQGKRLKTLYVSSLSVTNLLSETSLLPFEKYHLKNIPIHSFSFVMLYFQLSNLFDRDADRFYPVNQSRIWWYWCLSLFIGKDAKDCFLPTCSWLRKSDRKVYLVSSCIGVTPLPSFDTFYYIILFRGFRPCLGRNTGAPWFRIKCKINY